MGSFSDKLAQAIKVDELQKYVWKNAREAQPNGKFKQETVRLVDCNKETLMKYLDHCYSMIFSTDFKRPGRSVVLNKITDQQRRCGVELFLKDAESKGTSRFALVSAIRESLRNRGISQVEIKDMVVGDLVNCDQEYDTLPIELVIDGGLNNLGRFDKSNLTLNLLVKQGLWLTPEERDRLSPDFLNLKYKDRVKLILNNLGLNSDIKLLFDPLGLTLAEFKCALGIKGYNYSDLTTEQLRLLRNKLLFILEDEVRYHIRQWENRITEITDVMEYKGYSTE